MTLIERAIYNLVRSNPMLKQKIRNVYQKAFDFMPQVKPQFAYPIQAREGYFYGFHDHTPFSTDNVRLLAHHYLIPHRMPKLGEIIEVGYFDQPEYSRFTKVAETRAWTWHMGAKLQWRAGSQEIIFNDHCDGENISRAVNIVTGQSRSFPDSIGSVSPDGHWAVGYSFARVGKCMPGYGYHYDIGDDELEVEAPTKNGIHIIDLNSGELRHVLSLADLALLHPESTMQNAMHFVTHTVFSPDSKRFIFLHRWTKGGVDKRWSRLISCNLDGTKLYIFPTVDMVSHIGWRGPQHVVAYCRVPKFDDTYIVFKDQSPDDFELIGKNVLSSDGHPSFDPSLRWMLTDTYPDRRRMQKIIVYDTEKKERFDLASLPMPASFQSPSAYEHWACDLHPRWDRTGRYICFDSAYSGVRSLCTIDLGSAVGDCVLRKVSKKG